MDRSMNNGNGPGVPAHLRGWENRELQESRVSFWTVQA